MGIASTLLFTGFVYSQITLFKVRSVKRVWRINAHFRPLRVQKAEGVSFGCMGEQRKRPQTPCLALDLSSVGGEKKRRRRRNEKKKKKKTNKKGGGGGGGGGGSDSFRRQLAYLI